ncbi:MAG: ABC transporter ATP-binding protein [Deltaproteobacteria bacterium]|nr:ABC transporter ATP-binding protein [Deltaproteobacteria bacterium]
MPKIEIRGLKKRFGNNEVLKGVNLEIEEGEILVILGASGSGKSVLIKHIIGLLKPDEGSIIVKGVDITKLSEKALNEVRKSFGMVFQNSALFDSMTVYENVAFPLIEHTKLSENEVREKVREKLNILGLFDVEDKYPSELSGGMKKRVGLARAVILNPEIVLYDEPTTGLDPITTMTVNEMILDARERFNVTSIVISHDIGSAFMVADKIAFLYNGVIIAVGPPDQIRKMEDENLRKFLDTWFRKV